MSVVTLVALTLISSAQPRVAFMGLSSGEGVSGPTAASLSDALAAELRKQWKVDLVTSRELTAVLSMERQKDLLGCESSSCVAEIAGALDVDEVVTGSVSVLGESFLLQVQRVDARRALATSHASRRTKGGVDALLDQLPRLVGELVAGAKVKPFVPPPHVGKSTPPPGPLSPSFADVPYEKELARSKLEVLTDGKGLYLAVEPFAGLDGVFLAGTEKALYAQRVFGGGSERGKRFDFVFWEPRVKRPYQAEFAYREGQYTLTCGDTKVKLDRLAKKKATKLLQRAKIFDVRWQRFAHAIARDEDGNYFYVDRARTPEDSTDYRVFMGPRGALQGSSAEVLAQDAAGEVFKTSAGRLKLQPREQKAVFSREGQDQALTLLDIEGQARFVYTSLGVYAGEPLGTPCDGYLK